MKRRIPAGVLLTAIVAFSQEPLSLDRWKAKAGDDHRWAAPDYDDGEWAPVGSPHMREVEEAPANGIRWYRTTVDWAVADPHPLAIGMPPLEDAYEVYVNGQFAGRSGAIEPRRERRLPRHAVFRLPPAASSGRLVIAVRRWFSASTVRLSATLFGGQSLLRHPPRIGLAAIIEIEEEMDGLRGEQSVAAARFWGGILLLAAAGVALVLYRGAGRRTEYLWLALALLAAGAYPLLGAMADRADASPRGVPVLLVGLIQVSAPALATLFLRQLCPRLRGLLTATVAVEALRGFLLLASLALDFRLPQGTTTAADAFSLLSHMLAALTLAREPRKHSIALAVTLLLSPLARLWVLLLAPWVGAARYFDIGGNVFDPRALANGCFAVATLAILYLRFRDEQAEQEERERDWAAGQQAQQLLLDSGPAGNAAFRAEPVYLPARDVGGDFYQVAPQPDGSLLVVSGDVSGKGLAAALRGATVLGALRALDALSPAEVLTRLNRALVENGTTRGFVTCCCALLEPDGTVTLSSAGNPAPYLDGREMECPSGLPLGITTSAEYAEIRIEQPFEQMTFVSDGVIEAANASGELFGFDRARAASTKSAREIAEAARAWGQNDDITVVTVRRNG